MKIIVTLLLLMGLSLTVCSKPIIIGKEQAPINAHDYAVLKKVAENAHFPIKNFRHYKRNHYIIDNNGFLHWDEKKNGIIDGEDEAINGGVSRARNSYMTDKDGFVVAVSIDRTKFSDTTTLIGFSKLIAINLTANSVKEINLSNLKELRYFKILERDNLRVLTRLSNIEKLAFFIVNGLNTPNFNDFIGLKNLRKIDISEMALESFSGFENMPNLKDVTISKNSKKITSLSGIPKGHQLEKLKLSTASTSNIEGLANFTNLKELELWAKSRNLVDYTPLNKLKKLETLEVSSSTLSDFRFIEGMPKLKKIITYAPISSLEGVSGSPNLEHLELQGGYVSKIHHLDKNNEIKTLILNNQKINKLEGLSKLKKLNTLDISRNNIKKIEGLDNNLCLEKLWVAANPIAELENVYHLPLLRKLGLNKTKIGDIPRWKDLKRLTSLEMDISKLDSNKFTSGYFYVNIPIKEFDVQLRKQREKIITQEEAKRYGCI